MIDLYIEKEELKDFDKLKAYIKECLEYARMNDYHLESLTQIVICYGTILYDTEYLACYDTAITFDYVGLSFTLKTVINA